jgi:hypothetical protein
VRLVQAPDDGFWRVGRAPDPLEVGPPLARDELDDPKLGNRWDSPVGDYRVVYFGSEPVVCYGETLARFRPDPALAKVLSEEKDDSFMHAGELPADWRLRRLAVRATPADSPLMVSLFPDGVLFLDVEAIETREHLRRELGDVLAFYGYDDLDVAVVRGSDRRITRWISYYAHSLRPRVAGIRYLSRLSSEWECWGVFDFVELTELERRTILRTDTDLLEIAGIYGLAVF